MELKWTATRQGQLSSFLKGELNMSSGLMNRLKWGQSLRVNGIPRRTNYPVQAGDVITVVLDEQPPEYPAEDGNITVLYEDAYLLAVDKPALMLIHPSRSCFSGTLANLVAGYYQRTEQKSAFHPMTRLDRDTFGIVLLAKNAHVHSLLQNMDIQKTYHALTLGGPTEDMGRIDAPIARRPLPSLLREIREDGKPSVTEYAVLRRGEKTCKMALRPVTGRTHQLRLHCAYAGWPILGDPQYGAEKTAELSKAMGLIGQLLCAKTLKFTHPITGEPLTLESKLDVE